MLVVSDTSPISNLSIIGRLGLLRSQFREIWIPGAVKTELDSLPNPSGQTRIQRALSDRWIRPRAVEQNRMLTLLRSNLDSGEAEAIALAVELSAHLVLLDERVARNVADLVGLRVTGVLGVLLRAKEQKEISFLRPELEALRNRARFFISSNFGVGSTAAGRRVTQCP